MADTSATSGPFPFLRMPNGRLKQLLRYSLFPVTLVSIVGCSLYALEFFDGEAVGLAVFLMTIPLFLVLELVLPWQESWLRSRNDVHVDVGFVLTSAALAPLVGPLSQLMAVFIVGWLGTTYGMGLWPTDWPILAQGVLALVFGDFFRYWIHRAMHEIPLLWRIHATHHSSTRLYFFNGARSHPLEGILSGLAENVPFIVVGAPPAALLVRFIISRVIGRFQHCNLDLELGPLDYVFSSPRNHRWHHAKDPREGNSNYGGDIILWDHLFGTFYLPRDKEPPVDIGVGNVRDFPEGFFGLLFSPFTWSKYIDSPTGDTAKPRSLPDQ